jgi:chemotaxis protein methyltransferase CheR
MTDHLMLLRDLIHERTGLFFRDAWGLKTLATQLKPLVDKSGCHAFSEYYLLLTDGEKAASGEWLDLIAALTNNASSFYRHAVRARFLAETLIPRLLSEKQVKTLRIWSAACSTGEEPVSVAVALNEAGWFDRLSIRIDASDASFEAIDRARQGIYGERRMQALAPGLLDRYFAPAGDGWRIDPDLHGKIGWSVANLMKEDEVAGFAAADIVFCRNVFIYFSDSAIDRTLRLLGKYMPPGGYLFTDGGDHFTSLVTGTGLFEEHKIEGISVWKKAAIN